MVTFWVANLDVFLVGLGGLGVLGGLGGFGVSGGFKNGYYST